MKQAADYSALVYVYMEALVPPLSVKVANHIRFENTGKGGYFKVSNGPYAKGINKGP